MHASDFMAQQYTKIRLLKESDRGTVYLVTDKQGGLAILKHSQNINLPLREIKDAAIPLLPQIHYLVSGADEIISVEEYIHGQSLASLRQSGQYLTEHNARQIMLALSQGLAQLHALGIIHRDIKPEHILMETNGTPRLIDFDACRRFKDGQNEDTTLLGTKTYAPPEQFGFHQTDQRSDIYSLGMTIRELLPPDYRGKLLSVLDRCTNLDPAQRYQNMRELIAALQRTPCRRLFIVSALLACALLIFTCLLPLRPSHEPATTVHETTPTESPPSSENNPAAPGQAPVTQEQSPANAPIALPAPSSQPAQSIPPSPPADATAVPAADTKPQPEATDNYIRTQYFRNGHRLDGWTESSTTPINNAGTTITLPTKSYAKQIQDTGIVHMSTEDNATLRIINRSNQTWSNAYLTLHYICQEKQDSQTIPIGPLAPGETTDIPIPLNQYPLIIPDISTQAYGTLNIELTSDSPQEIRNSHYHFTLLYQP